MVRADNAISRGSYEEVTDATRSVEAVKFGFLAEFRRRSAGHRCEWTPDSSCGKSRVIVDHGALVFSLPLRSRFRSPWRPKCIADMGTRSARARRGNRWTWT
jgi:hypothetical protein